MAVDKMIKFHGMTDDRWVNKDKLSQYRGLINLFNRDRKQQLSDVSKRRRKQYREIRDLKKECDYLRNSLDNSMFGDRQRLRNALQHHRKIQLAYQGLIPNRVLDHLQYVNTIKQKELDRLRYRRKQRMKVFSDLKYELAELQDRMKSKDSQIALKRVEQVVTNQIQNVNLKQNAALSISTTYKNILAILKKDSIYFDTVLEFLRNDSLVQCRCVIRATELGQIATEDLANIYDEYHELEKKVKMNMRERDNAVKQLRRDVNELYSKCKMLTRTESDAELKMKGANKSNEFLPMQLAELETVMKQVQNVTLVSTYDDIFPRMEDQHYHKQRLLNQMKLNESMRDDLLNMRNHAELMLVSLQHSMADTAYQYKETKNQLLSEIKDETTHIENEKYGIEECGQMLVLLRMSIHTLFEMLSRIRDPEDYDDDSEQELQQDGSTQFTLPPVYEDDVVQLLKTVGNKLTMLICNVTEQLDEEHMEQAKMLYQQQIIETLSREEFGDIDNYDFPLVEDNEPEDAAVLSRAEVKLRSKKIVEQFEKPSLEMQLMSSRSTGRMKRRQTKWM